MPVGDGIRGSCPHCGTIQRFETPHGFRVPGGKARMELSGLDVQAPAESGFMGTPDHGYGVRLGFAACTECRRVSVTARPIGNIFNEPTDEAFEPAGQVIYPMVSASAVPVAVEDEDPVLAKDVRDAHAVLAISPKASAALARRCLQHVVRTKAEIRARTLFDELEQLKPQLPGFLADKVDHVRSFGNAAAHPIAGPEPGTILDVAPDEAEYTLFVLDLLLDHFYVTPRRARDMEERLHNRR